MLREGSLSCSATLLARYDLLLHDEKLLRITRVVLQPSHATAASSGLMIGCVGVNGCPTSSPTIEAGMTADVGIPCAMFVCITD